MNNGLSGSRHKQQGFSIVMAIFILVVLGLLGGYMVRFSGVQQATSSFALQGARAYQAANGGLGWAIAKINAGGTCVEITAQGTLSFPDLTGFSVSLSCTSTTYREGNDSPIIYQLSALSEFGAYGSTDYVYRKLEMSIAK